MSRPKNNRTVNTAPIMEGFRPFGVPAARLEPLMLTFDEYESVRLCDYENLDQTDASKQMNVSRPTFTRIYKSARRTIARAFVEGKAIFIEGGSVTSDSNWYRCKKCGKLIISHTLQDTCDCCPEAKLKLIQAADIGAQMTDYCICGHCGHKTKHKEGEPCHLESCSKCGRPMMREGGYHHQMQIKKQKNN